MKKSTKIGLSAGVGLLLLGAIVSGGGDDTKAEPNDRAAVQPSATSGEKPAAKVKEPKKSQAEEFAACVNKSGTSAEKAAVKHVTKVTGADDFNGILDAPEVFTTYTGGFMSKDAGGAKLIASAFAGCYKSDNGLVTVYGSDGEMISNGKF